MQLHSLQQPIYMQRRRKETYSGKKKDGVNFR